VNESHPADWAADQFFNLAIRIGMKTAVELRVARDDVENCVQDYLLKIMLMKDLRQRLQAPPWQVYAFLSTCARNHTLNFKRAVANRNKIIGSWSEIGRVWELADDAPTPEEWALQTLIWEQIDAALDALEAEQSALFVAYYMEQRSTRELASQLGCTIHAVQLRLWRIRRHLRACLEDSALPVLSTSSGHEPETEEK
jgi:RNA polymerase sigma-70 factor (ECF subfamily)